MNYDLDLEKIGRYIFPFYLSLIFIAPIPFGSNRPWAWAFLLCCTCLLLLVYLWSYARKNLRPPELTFDIKLIFCVLIIWLLYQIMQLVPLPVEYIAAISPKTLELKQSLFGLEKLNYMTLSFDVSTSIHSVYKSILYICFFVLTICLIQSKDRLRILILTIVMIGVIQSVLGISLYFIEKDMLLVSEPKDVMNVVKGTFVNRNHFAGFINLSIAAAIALMLASGLKEKRSIHRDAMKHHWQSRLLDWRVYLIPYLGIMLISLLLSESRGAMLSNFVMFFVLFSCLLMMKVSIKDIYSNYKILIWLVGIAAITIGGDVISERFIMLSDDLTIRMAHWQNSMMIIKDFTLFGTGGGSFQHIYPLYDTGVDKYRLLHAHNDYLELLVEQGVVGFSLLGMVVLICIKNAVRAIRRFSNLQQSAFAISSLIAISGFLIHGFLDFNFQIPSNALYFFVFLAIALLQGMESTHSEIRETVWDEKAFGHSMRPDLSK